MGGAHGGGARGTIVAGIPGDSWVEERTVVGVFMLLEWF
jgi:hypothetical protein